MAPTPPFYHELNQFCDRFGVKIRQKREAEGGQVWEFFIPDEAFLKDWPPTFPADES